MNEYTFADITVGLEASFEREITLDMENKFREISGDENPLHRDDAFAATVGDGRFPGHVAFGMLTASLYSTLAGMYLPGKYSLIHSFDKLSFVKPVFAGDILTTTGQVVEKVEALNLIQVNAAIRNQNNQVVSKAKIKILLTK